MYFDDAFLTACNTFLKVQCPIIWLLETKAEQASNPSARNYILTTKFLLGPLNSPIQIILWLAHAYGILKNNELLNIVVGASLRINEFSLQALKFSLNMQLIK